MKWLAYLLPPRPEEAFVVRQAGASESGESPSPEAKPSNPLAGAMEEDVINGSLRRLLDETSDLVDSPTFCHVLTRILDAACSNLVDYRIATEAFKVTGPTAPGVDDARVVEISDAKVKLAHILPVFCRQAHTIAAGSGELDTIAGVAAQEPLGNEYLVAIDRVHDLEAFAAVIYSSNFEAEVSARDEYQETDKTPAPAPEAAVDAGEDEVDEEKFDLGESTQLLPEDVTVQEPAVGTVEEPTDPGLEAAWKKAIAAEDGKVPSDAPVPVED